MPTEAKFKEFEPLKIVFNVLRFKPALNWRI